MMDTLLPKLTYASDGTPGISARDVTHAYFGLGWLHARHRPLQSWLVHAAGRAELAATLVPSRELVEIDALVRRLGIPERATAEARNVSRRAGEWLDAYLAGFRHGLHERGRPWELALLGVRVRAPDRAAVLGGLLVSAHLGLAQSQERMEQALLAALDAGAEAGVLETMFRPHLEGWEPSAMRGLGRRPPLGFAAHGLPSIGGSNAWAVDASRSGSGSPLLAGDPHLSFNQMPALFFEVRARVGDDTWLGATIPGLPGLALGRNRRVAWSGTFGCADNVDFTIEQLEAGQLQRGDRFGALALREVEVRRRWRRALRLRFWSSEHGTLLTEDAHSGATLAVQWAGSARVGEALAAYMELPCATSAREAERILQSAHTLSLHFVLADATGDVRYCQAGRIPRRSHGWSGLYPVPAGGERRWMGFYEGASLPRCDTRDGFVASANEARLAADGGVLATMAQPPYRLHRIEQLLRARLDHDVASMQAMHLDVLSLQGLLLRDVMVEALPDGPVRTALRAWDGSYDVDSTGAHAFEIAYLAGRDGLAPALGGAWFRAMLRESELGTWWAGGLDRLLEDPTTWRGPLSGALRAALATIANELPRPWGSVQQVRLDHIVFGALPKPLRLHRGPFALPGSRATVRQTNVHRFDGKTAVTAPAYRMVADLSDDGLYTSLPGGIDGSPFAPSYDRWLADYLAGRYHHLAAPTDDESQDWQR